LSLVEEDLFGTSAIPEQAQDMAIGLTTKFIDAGDCVTITVHDDVRKIKRDFKCKRTMILTYMNYFEQYLKDSRSGEQLDISVHCDVKIFEWLVRYVDFL
jgi:hypothetical protein